MGFISPDLIIKRLLGLGEHAILSSPDDILNIIFAEQAAEERAEFKAFLLQGVEINAKGFKRRIPKYLALPSTPPQAPAMIISVGSENEVARSVGDIVEHGVINRKTGVLLDPDVDTLDEDSYEYTSIGSRYAGRYSITIIDTNETRLIWLQSMVKYILHSYRDYMETEYGLMRQSISCAELIIPPDQYPDVAFARRVDLSCEFYNSYLEYAPMLEALTLNATWYDVFGRELEDG